MQALHSSAALAYNIFEYWRNRPDAIARACGFAEKVTRLRFEATHATGLGGIPPHLDVEFDGGSREALCIEAKFTELYQGAPQRTMKDAYYTTAGLWKNLPRCGAAAEMLRSRETYSRLDTPQLLKHILGLVRSYGRDGFRLLYLWYDFPSAEADEHRWDLADFAVSLDGEVQFCHLTYQELFEVIRNLPEVDQTYVAWLQERYFGGSQ